MSIPNTALVLGANTVIDQPHCTVAVSTQSTSNSHQSLNLGDNLGLLWLPLDAQRNAACSPAYLHESKTWATLIESESSAASIHWKLDLPHLFDTKGVNYLQLIAYTYHEPNLNLPAVEITDINLSLNGDNISYHFQAQERHVKAAIILEIYRRNGQYKCRALGEASTLGLDNLAQKVQISLDTRLPSTHAGLQAAQQNQMPNDDNRPPRQVAAGETWTGTAFAIDPYHLLTCYHVIESASILGVRQQGEPDREAQVVMSDVGSDTAIIKVSQPLSSYLTLASHYGDILGETITTLGFPLSGLNSQLQVTQGCISGLTGFRDDIRYMQFTAPIQPGSSGSPLLLPTGDVVGMVTASLSQAQNMNYAVKFQMLSALLTSAGIILNPPEPKASLSRLSTPELSRLGRSALWMVGAQA